MKERDFFKALNEELTRRTPPPSARLLSEPIAPQAPSSDASRESADSDSTEPIGKKRGRKGRFSGRFYKYFGSVAAALVVLCAAILSAFATGVFSRVAGKADSLMYVDINPSVVVVLDGDYTVKKAVSRNADADSLLSDETFRLSLTGSTAAEAALLLAERAAMAGYLDPENTGEGKYNLVKVSFLSETQPDKELLSSVSETLVGGFRAKGMFVYAEVSSAIGKNAEEEAKKYLNTPYEYFRQKQSEAENNVAELEKSVEEAFFSYASDLLKDAFRRYDLFCEIDALNEKLGSETNGLKNYWTSDGTESGEIPALESEISARLEELYLLYGEDFRDRNFLTAAAFELSFASCRSSLATIPDERLSRLRELGAEGLNAENFGGTENFGLRLSYFNFVSNEFLRSVSSALWSGVSLTADDLISDLSELVRKRADERFSRYAALYERERAPLSDDAYAAFLRRIGKSGE